MKIVYPICCGIDVHKTFIVAVIVKSDSINPTYLKKRFSTFHNDLIRFRDWLISNHCDNVCMESTGKYWIPIYNILEDHIPNVVVANPKWVKAIKGEKMTIRMPNGLLISLKWVSLEAVLFLLKIFVFLENALVISLNLSITVLLKRIVSKML